jgi:hypothetical protein
LKSKPTLGLIPARNGQRRFFLVSILASRISDVGRKANLGFDQRTELHRIISPLDLLRLMPQNLWHALDPPEWLAVLPNGQELDGIFAITKSEARSVLKGPLGIHRRRRLPIGTTLERITAAAVIPAAVAPRSGRPE